MAKKTKGWLDNYGEEANANEGTSSASKEWRGEGYSNVGRNYSPAWGGQFQPGGNLPIASSSSVKTNTLSKIALSSGKNDVNEFTNYATIINSYPDIANDTSYLMTKIGSNGEEQFFYNTNRGNPISNYNKGRDVVPVSSSMSNDLRKEILAGVGGFRDGGKAQKGKKVIIDGKEYDTASEEYIDMLDKGLIGTMQDGNFWGNKSTLQPIVLYSSRDKDTQKFFNKFKEDDSEQYETLIELQKRYGHPHITLKDKPGFFDPSSPDNSEKMRAHYNANRQRMYLSDTDDTYKLKEDYLAELAHQKQVENKGSLDFNLRLLSGFGRTAMNMIKNFESPVDAYNREYETPGNLEYEAHEEIQPKLEDEYNDIYWDKLGQYDYYKNPGTFSISKPKNPKNPYKNGGQFQVGGNIGTRPEDEDIREIDAWEKQYTNSPRFTYLSQKQGDSPEMTQNRRNVINAFNVDKNIFRVPEGASYIADEDDNGSPEFYLSPDAGDWPSYSDINAHEMGHLAYNTGNLNFPKKTYDEIQARNIEFQKTKASGKINDNIEHDINPNEVRADKNQLLYQLKKLGIYDATKDGDITPKQLEQFKKSGKWNRLQRLYSDEDMLWLINNVAKNDSGVSNTAKMGASIPGSVGFTYARTKGIPSEGPYAKKTMPSAQNGQEMRYYQEGLDWRPKTISKNGSSIEKGQVGTLLTVKGTPTVPSEGTPYNLDFYESFLPMYKETYAPPSNFGGDIYDKIFHRLQDEKGYDPHTAGRITSFLNKTYETSGEIKDDSFFPTDTLLRTEAEMSGNKPKKELTKEEREARQKREKELGIEVYNAGGVMKAQKGIFIPGVTDFNMPRGTSESVSTGVQNRDFELERQLALEELMASQPQLRKDRTQTIGEKKESIRKKKQYVSNKPNTEINDQNEIVQKNPDRGFEGQPLTPNAKRFDKGLSHIMDAIETTGAVTGLGSVGTNLLRLGAGALETQIGRNLLSRNLKNFTSRVSPTINAIDNAAAYVQMDPIGIMGNRLNSQFYNPTVALNTANNTLTGVERNLKNSAVETADLIAGENNLRNLTGSSVENVALPKITPEQWKDMSGYLGRRQFVKGLQKEGLVGKEFNLGDVNYAARSTAKTDALTKLALDRRHTAFRNVRGKLPETGIGRQEYSGYSYDMNKPAIGQTISEVDNMINAGVDFTNPKSIAEYQATHIPLQDYGYRSTGEWEVPEYGFLFRNPGPTSSKNYGNFQFKSAPNLNFESGNYKDWFKKYYEDLNYHRGNPNVSGGPSRKDNLQDLMFWTKSNEPSVSSATLVGPRGTKAFEIDKSFPFTNMENLSSEQSKSLQNYIQEYNKQYNTGWRGQYKKGGVIKDNRGYWNPDNWGEVVEIDSPYITMKGVNKPLLGISDTGDVQYMEPGQDYEFDGNKVTEFPIPTAQVGTRQPIYTDDPRKVKAYQDSVRLNKQYPFMEGANKVGSSSPGDMFMLKTLHPEYFANKKNQPIAAAVTRDHDIYEYKNMSPKDVSLGKMQNQVLGPMHAKPVQPYILKEEPKLKGKVSQVNKLPMGEPSTGMGIRERQMPNISAPNVEMSGPYMAGYTDFDTQQGMDRGFRSAEERDAFVEELRKRPAGNYQPSQMNISSYYDVNKRREGGITKAQDGWTKDKAENSQKCDASKDQSGMTRSERKEEKAYDKAQAKADKEAAEQKKIASDNYVNMRYNYLGDQLEKADYKARQQEYNQFLQGNPNFAKDPAYTGQLTPEQRYALINNTLQYVQRAPQISYATRLGKKFNIADPKKLTMTDMMNYANQMGGYDKFREWYDAGGPEIQRYGGVTKQTKKVNQNDLGGWLSQYK
jgi:hypothetical protein